jgi:hypothetical protein
MAVAGPPTAGDIIALSLFDAGIVGTGQTPQASDANKALTRLNDMIAQWTRRRWLVYHLIDVSKVSTGAVSYTVGAGGDFDTPRPDRLEQGCFVRLLTTTAPNQIDYSLQLIEARENYNQIAMKQMGSFPQAIFYDAAFPLGRVYPWPVPNTQYEIHLNIKGTLDNFPTLATAYNLPPEYAEAIRLNLIVRLRAAYQLTPDPTTDRLALVALNTIKNANAQIPFLQVPRELVRPRSYNFWSDTDF